MVEPEMRDKAMEIGPTFFGFSKIKTKKLQSWGGGSVMNWCESCHEKPMWCGKKNCINRADLFAAWQKQKVDKVSTSGNKPSSSRFQIALAAMTSTKDSEALQEQVASLKN